MRAWLMAAVVIASSGAGITSQAVGQVVSEFLGPAAARFHASAEAQRAAGRSWSVEVLPPERIAQVAAFGVVPEFASEPGVDGGQPTAIVRVAIEPGMSLYGLGPTPGAMMRDGFVSDRPVATPWVLAVRRDGTAFGVLADTAAPVRVDLRESIEMRLDRAGAGGLPVLVIVGESPERVVVLLNQLTGRMEMPPMWGLGLHWGPVPAGEAGRVAGVLAERGVEVASVVVEPAAGAAALPEPNETDLAVLRQRGPRLVLGMPWVFEPSVATEVVRRGGRGGHLVVGDEWTWVNFAAGRTRHWWAGQLAERIRRGASGFEMVSPTVAPAMSEAAASSGDFEGDVDVGDGGWWSERVLASRATRAARDEEVGSTPRLMVFSEVAAATAQRGHALLLPSEGPMVPTLLSAGLSGFPLAGRRLEFGGPSDGVNGADVGLSAVAPLVLGTGSVEDGSGLAALRGAQRVRAALMPYLYTRVFDAFMSCEPIARPVFFAAAADPTLRAREDAFLLGPDVLVVPGDGGDEGAGLAAHPAFAGWRPLDVGELAGMAEGAGQAPRLARLYIRPGAIVPLAGGGKAYSVSADPLVLVANLAGGEGAEAIGRVYEDAGDGYDFYNNGARIVRYRVNRQGPEAFARVTGMDGGLGMPQRRVRVVVMTETGTFQGEGSERGTIRIRLGGI